MQNFLTNLVNRVYGRASGASMKPLTLFKTPRGPLPTNIHHPARGAVHARVGHGPAWGSLQPGVCHCSTRRPHYPAFQHSARRLLSLQWTAWRLVPPKLCASLSVTVWCAWVSMDQRIGCQPFRDVLIVGRRTTLVGTVGRNQG